MPVARSRANGARDRVPPSKGSIFSRGILAQDPRGARQALPKRSGGDRSQPGPSQKRAGKRRQDGPFNRGSRQRQYRLGCDD